MSTPGDAGPSGAAKEIDRRRSMGKYIKRMSSVFKREKSSSGVTSPTTASPAPKAEPKVEDKPAAPAAAAPTPAPATTAPPPAPVAHTQELNRAVLQQERARALFAKYNLAFEAHEWITPSVQPVSVQRVEKPIRMRVHRSCHHCGTSFGPEKVCLNCEHKRCKKCPRYPKKKSPGEKGKEREEDLPKKKKKLLAITTRTGEERVYQPPKQRVRRTCHKCHAFFIPATAPVCNECRHVRCTKCPREPAKLTKWPHGYPGDAEPGSDTEVDDELDVRRLWRKPRIRVRWECEECHSNFIEGSPLCPGCGHERCEKCTRKPLKRVKKEMDFDPAVIRAVEEKLRAFALDDGPGGSDTEATKG